MNYRHVGFGVLALLLISGCRDAPLASLRDRIHVDPQAVDFGATRVGLTRDHAISIENISRTRTELTLEAAAPFSSEVAELTLEPGEAREVILHFTPNEAGEAQGTLDVRAGTADLTVALHGSAEPVPECHPSSPCMAAHVDPATGGCIEAPVSDGTSCADACLLDGACIAGQCEGHRTICPDDGDLCTQETCDPTIGCTRTDWRATCEAQATPCMSATCRIDGGCDVEPVPDSTICGEVTCTESHLCQDGTCVEGDPAQVRGAPICAEQLGVAQHHVLAQLDGGRVAYWGAYVSKPTSSFAGIARPRWFPYPWEVTALSHGGNVAACVQGVDAGWSCLGADPPQFGLPRNSNHAVWVATRVPSLAGAVEVNLNDYQSCARMADDSLHCVNPSANTTDFVPVPEVGAVRSFSSGINGSCAVSRDGGAWCWSHISPPTTVIGPDGGYPLVDDEYFGHVPAPVDGVANAETVVTGDRFACARLDGGEVDCWGSNEFGQLGSPAAAGPDAGYGFSPRPIPEAFGATALCAGPFFACALMPDGTVRCWGRNERGQLGLGTASASGPPGEVLGLTDVVEIGCGYGSTCARRSDSTVWCWGDNVYGTVGQGSASQDPTPAFVTTPTQITW